MASLREIKIRIKSVKSTRKITKAMEMIAASKMKRAQQQAIKGRPYINRLRQVIANLVYGSEPKLTHPYLEERTKVKNAGYIFITANRGLCGAFNTNVTKVMLQILQENKHKNELVLSVGRKGRLTMERIGKKVLADFENMGDKPGFLDTVGISKVMADDFLSGKLDEVYVVYNHFFSTMTQKPVVVKLLPVDIEKEFHRPKQKREYLFEPGKELLLDELLKRYIETTVYQTVLESIAAEHSARMMAMRQASDNAGEIVSNLTLHYNKKRQEKITTQILEVVAGS
jgi:F-type H+-transporting ATPase subunit gamma